MFVEEFLMTKKLDPLIIETISCIPDGVVVLSIDGVVLYQNDTSLEMFENNYEGKVWTDVISKIFSPKPTDGNNISLFNGKLINMTTNSFNGVGQLILLKDLTETVKIQNVLSRNQRLLSMGSMSASIAHQIRTPIATALLYMNKVSDKQSGDKYTQKIKSSLSAVNQIIENMLMFARDGDMSMSKVSIVDILQQAIMSTVDSSSKKSVNIVFESGDVGAKIFCAKEVLTSCFINVIGNAIEASPLNGNVYVSLLALKEEPSVVFVEIKDQGAGIKKEYQSSIFDPFFTTKNTGTGLGLSVVKSVVENHGGAIGVDGNYKEGASFLISLPVDIEDKL